ncbi:hypothetical protein GQ44DRAFT_613513, partial [Phaeosphaeriaceae sp. PMI808]
MPDTTWSAPHPHLPISFHEPTLSDRLQRRDSRIVEFHFPIEEEDESTGTASEPAEPLTPTSHTSENASFSNPFPHHEHADDGFTLPKPAMTD